MTGVDPRVKREDDEGKGGGPHLILHAITLTVPAALLDGIVGHFDPVRIIVFGSQARGDADANSDWDLLVIVDDDAPRERLTLRAGFESTRAYGLAADVVPIRAGRFAERKDIVNSLAWLAEHEGVIVYERAPPPPLEVRHIPE